MATVAASESETRSRDSFALLSGAVEELTSIQDYLCGLSGTKLA